MGLYQAGCHSELSHAIGLLRSDGAGGLYIWWYFSNALGTYGK